MIVINSVKLHIFYFYFRAILKSPRVSAHDVNPPDPVFVIMMMERIKEGIEELRCLQHSHLDI